MVVQPGGASHLPTAPLTTGPRLFETVPQPERFQPASIRRPYERFVVLEHGADPPGEPATDLAAETGPVPAHHGDLNKIGGTPLFLQGDQCPPGEGWRFAFQFAMAWAGDDDGDGAECFGFVGDDLTAARSSQGRDAPDWTAFELRLPRLPTGAGRSKAGSRDLD